MAQARRSNRSGIWADALAAGFEFFPEEAGLVLLAGAAAGFVLLVIVWAATVLLEKMEWT